MRAQLPVGIVGSWPRWAAAFITVIAVLWAGTWFRGPAAMWSAIALAAAGEATLWMAVLADTGASALVVANAVRLRKFQ